MMVANIESVANTLPSLASSLIIGSSVVET